MSFFQAFRLRRLAAVAAGLLLVPLAVAVIASSADAPPVVAAKPTAATTPVPMFAKTTPAENAPVLVLQPDDRGIRGWIAGGTSFAGKDVTFSFGDKSEAVRIRDDNTFAFNRTVQEPTTVTATVKTADAKSLESSALLVPPVPVAARSIFFVTDRSAYRPGHTLKFVGFLRTLTEAGEFEPIPNEAVNIDITSNTKQSRAARLPLKSDEFGRVTGTYTFSTADPLDDYTLSAENYTGSGSVRLGEYRKTKMGLTIAGAVKDGKLNLTFTAKDYLGRVVKGTEATYTAEVVKAVDPGPKALDPSEFAHLQEMPPTADDFAKLPDDERLLAIAHGVSATTFAGLVSQQVAARTGVVKFAEAGPGTVELDLNPEWLKGNYTVAITSVLVDETGRESRSTETFPLSAKPTRGVRLSVLRELVAAGVPVPVSVEPFGLAEKDGATTTVLVMKLDANPGFPWAPPQIDPESDELPDGLRLPALNTPKKGAKPAEVWTALPVYDPVRRTLVTALPVTNNQAIADLKRPGAYKLVAITRLKDGTILQAEAGLAIKKPEKLPTLVLELEKHDLPAASRLRGTVHTRFANAKMLLTLRDAVGIRLTKPLVAGADGIATIDVQLPPNLRYGCSVSVQYPESANAVHIDQRELFVDPTDRTLTVTAKAPPTVGPGDEVPVEVSVNRNEEIDLIVSVYDDALLAVVGDLSKNIRNYYLADVRGQDRSARELAARKVGDVTVAELVAKAKDLLKAPDILLDLPALKVRLERFVQRWWFHQIAADDLFILMQLAGQEVYIANGWYNANERVQYDKNVRLADVIRQQNTTSVAVVNDVTMLSSAGGGFGGNSAWAMLRYPRYNFGGGFQGFGGGGFAGSGGYQGGFQNFGGGGGFGSLPRGQNGFGGGGFQGGFSLQFNSDFATPASIRRPAPGTDVVRRDFADAAFWSAQVRTDKTGKATVKVRVPDSLTSWRVAVTAISPKMHVGSGSTKFQSKRPVMIWPMLPRAFTAGDTVRVFGTVHNLTDKEQTIQAKLTAENGQVLSVAEKTVTVPANGSVPVEWDYKAGKAGTTDLLMAAEGPAGKDASLKVLPVMPPGLIERATASGLVGKGKLAFTLPDDFDPKSATVNVTVAPTLAADMADTLPFLVEYPHGCVEQTMSRFLPALRVAQILKQSGISLPELEKMLPKVVEAGVKRLLELQQPDGGWGWQGGGQTHEMMTPYALLGLLEAKKAGYPIPNEHALATGMHRLKGYLQAMGPTWDVGFVGDKEVNRPQFNDCLYCLSVLSRAEAVPAEWWKRIDSFAGTKTISDYGHALALELAMKEGPPPLQMKLAGELRKRAKKSDDRVFWTTAGFSHWGDNTTEVTAAVLKALVAYTPDDALIPGILTYFHSTKRGDRWDSTKDTAAVLYAFCDYLTATKSGTAREGKVSAALNGGPAMTLEMKGPLSKTIALPAAALKPGKNVIDLTGEAQSGSSLARVVVRFSRTGSDIPARDHGIKVTRTISVRKPDGTWAIVKSGAKVPKGSYLKIHVLAESPVHDMSYTLIESPKPATGETVPVDDKRFPNPGGYSLREDRETMGCFHYEHSSNAYAAEYVVLAEFAGKFRVPPARAEMMYRPTHDGHSDSFDLVVE